MTAWFVKTLRDCSDVGDDGTEARRTVFACKGDCDSDSDPAVGETEELEGVDSCRLCRKRSWEVLKEKDDSLCLSLVDANEGDRVPATFWISFCTDGRRK